MPEAANPFEAFEEPLPAPAGPPPSAAAPTGPNPFEQYEEPMWAQGPLGAMASGALGAIDVPTLGLAGHFLADTNILPGQTQEALKRAQPLAHGIAGGASLIAANFIPGLGEAADVAEGAELAGGAAAGARTATSLIPSNALVNIAGHLVPDAAKGASALARMGVGTARGAVEGALFTGGQTAGDLVTNMVMGDPDHAAEHILSNGAMNTLLTAGLGGALGGGISGLGVLKDLVAPTMSKIARAASDTIAGQKGDLALDVLNVNKVTLGKLYKKGDRGLDTIKEAMGVEGEDFPEVLGNVLARPTSVAPNTITGELEPLITAHDTAETVNTKIQDLKEAAGRRIGAVYEHMDTIGPGIVKQDLVDSIETQASKFKGDPAMRDVRTELRTMAKLLGENDGDMLSPSEVWNLRRNNDQNIWNKTTGVLRQNVDAEEAYRETLDKALKSYGEDIPSLSAWPNMPTGSGGFDNLTEELQHANGEYRTWTELGRLSDMGRIADLKNAKGPLGILTSAGKSAFQGSKAGAMIGGIIAGPHGALAGSALGGAAYGAAKIARDLVSGSMTARTLAATRELADYSGHLAPAIRTLTEESIPRTVEAMWSGVKETAPEVSGSLVHELRPWELPHNATVEDVARLDHQLSQVGTSTGALLTQLRQSMPNLAASMHGQVHGVASAIRMNLPKVPMSFVPGGARAQRVQPADILHSNHFAQGAILGVDHTLKHVARGTVTAAMVQGSRLSKPRMAARADGLMLDKLRKHPEILDDPRVRHSVGLWFGRQDPQAQRVALAVQRTVFPPPSPHAGPGMAEPTAPQGMGQARINRIKSPTSMETWTQGNERRLGK